MSVEVGRIARQLLVKRSTELAGDQASKKLADILDEQIGRLGSGEVAAVGHFRPVHDIVRALGKAANRLEILGKHRDARRGRIVDLPIPRAGLGILGAPGRMPRPGAQGSALQKCRELADVADEECRILPGCEVACLLHVMKLNHVARCLAICPFSR